MKKLIVILLFYMLLSGCDFKVHNHEIESYIENCKDHNGLAYIDNFGTFGAYKDGYRTNGYIKKSKKLD